MMPKDAASDNLSDEVERRIREAVKSWPRDRGEAAMNVEALHAIVSVAVEMLREERNAKKHCDCCRRTPEPYSWTDLA